MGLVMDFSSVPSLPSLPSLGNIVRSTSMEPIQPVFHAPIIGRVYGYDERFPLQSEELSDITLWLYYLEQIQRLEKKSLILEEIQQDLFIKELFYSEISSGEMKAGGLMDDWLRDI